MNETPTNGKPEPPPLKLTPLVRYEPGSLFQAISHEHQEKNKGGQPAIHIVGPSGKRALCPYPLDQREPRKLGPEAVATCTNCIELDKGRREARARYDAYRRTDAWQEKRELVKARAGNVCEGCRKRPPVETHHITYKHIYNEFLFELVALCEPCHRRLHPQLDVKP